MNNSTYFFLLFSITVHAIVFTPVATILWGDSPTQNVSFNKGKNSFRVLLKSKKISMPSRSSNKQSSHQQQVSKPSQKQTGVQDQVKKIALSPPEYPEESRLYGEEGEVVVSVKVGESGWPKKVALISSSGFERLDQSVLTKINQTQFIGQEAAQLELSFKFELQD